MEFNINFSSSKVIFGFSGLILIVVGLVLYFFVFSGSSPTSPLGQLALCLNDQGATMYSLPSCPHCQEQKDKFGDHLEHLKYVNCAVNREKCREAGIKTVPTWIIEGERLVGVQKLEKLADKAGCQYP